MISRVRPLTPAAIRSLGGAARPEPFELKKAFASGQTVFERAQYYEFLARHPLQTRQTVEAWYPRNDALVSTFERALGSKHLGLLLDPGIAARADDFLSFTQAPGNASSFALRRAYERHLQQTTVYRGLMTVPEVMARIETEGKLAPRGLTSKDFQDGIGNLYRPFFPQGGATIGLSELLDLRIRAKGLASSPVMSVSEVIEATHIAAWEPGRSMGHGSTVFYGMPREGTFSLVEFTLPTLSVVPMTGVFAALREKLAARGTYLTKTWDRRGDFRVPLDDARLEHFVFGRRRFSRLHHYQSPPPMWFRET
jgi:hypothetical protein